MLNQVENIELNLLEGSELNLLEGSEFKLTNVNELADVSEIEKDNTGRLSWSF